MSRQVGRVNQQSKGETPLMSGVLQRAAVRAVAEKEVESGTLRESRFRHDFSQVGMDRGGLPPIQAKLTIGAPNDKYEQEADRVASQVVQQINAPASVQSSQGQSVQRTEAPEEEEIQAKPDNTSLQRRVAIAGGESSTNLESAISRARGGGQLLEAGLQQSMGQAMGADFSGVKVHTDAQSDQLNQSIQAKAFTTGQDVFFRQGAYEPGSRGGQELIAHELTHVVQQEKCDAIQRNGDESVEPAENQEAVKNPQDFMVAIAKDGQGWEYITKTLYKQGNLTWGEGNDPKHHGLDAIHKRRKKIIEESIDKIKPKVKEQVYFKRLKLQTGLEPGYVPNDEDQVVMEQIMSNIKELGGEGLGSDDPTSDVDVTLTGDGTDIAVELLNEQYQKTPEGKTGVSFAYLYDVNYYPAAFVPEKDAILAQKAFSSNRDKWRDETITNPNIKARINENEEITAWLHVKLDVSKEQWEPIEKILQGKIIQYPENKTRSNTDESFAGSFAEEVRIRAEKRESVGRGQQGNDRLVAETEEFGKVSAEVFDARERYLEAKREAKRQEDEYIKYLLGGNRALEDTIFMQERLDTLRKPVELAYADLMEGMDKAGVYANEGMFTSGAIRVVVANMQVLGIDWENKNSQPESIEDIKKKSSDLQSSSVEEMSKDEPKTREQKRAVHEELLRGNRKLKLKGNELYNSIIEHYGRILHVLNNLDSSANPTEGIAKVGKYLHRYYRSVYDWQQLQGKKRHIITRNELLYAQQLEGVKKQKTRTLNETQREVAGIEDIALWSSADSNALTNASIEAMKNLFDISNGKEISMMALRIHVEKKITDIFNLVNTQLSKS